MPFHPASDLAEIPLHRNPRGLCACEVQRSGILPRCLLRQKQEISHRLHRLLEVRHHSLQLEMTPALLDIIEVLRSTHISDMII